MTNQWRLVDNKELYDIQKDPGQKNNVINQYPEVVKSIQQEHKKYWAKVSPGHRDKPRFIVGHKNDQETYLTSSDWFLIISLRILSAILRSYPSFLISFK